MAGERPTKRLTIDELAQEAGLTVRNIRSHHSRGLLPPPEIEGRIGYYGEPHLARLKLIKHMQAGGFNLAAIKTLVERADRSDEEIDDIRSLVLRPFSDEPPETTTLAELISQFGDDPAVLQRAIDLELLNPISHEIYEVVSPTLMRAAAESVSLGIGPVKLLDLLERIYDSLRDVSENFARLVDEELVRPFERNGYKADEWNRVSNAIERLRPLATDVVLASFQMKMSTAAEQEFGRVMTRMAEDVPERPPGD